MRTAVAAVVVALAVAGCGDDPGSRFESPADIIEIIDREVTQCVADEPPAPNIYSNNAQSCSYRPGRVMAASIVEDAEARADAAEYLYGVNDGVTVVEGGNWVVMTNPVYAERVADVLGGTVVEE